MWKVKKNSACLKYGSSPVEMPTPLKLVGRHVKLITYTWLLFISINSFIHSFISIYMVFFYVFNLYILSIYVNNHVSILLMRNNPTTICKIPFSTLYNLTMPFDMSLSQILFHELPHITCPSISKMTTAFSIVQSHRVTLYENNLIIYLICFT